MDTIDKLSINKQNLHMSPTEFEITYRYLEHNSDEPPSVLDVLEFFYAIDTSKPDRKYQKPRVLK